jgi:hypothetical protein
MSQYKRLQALTLLVLLASCNQQAPPEEAPLAVSVATTTVEARVVRGTDDAEEAVATGRVNPSSDDLELTTDGSTQQMVGVRFDKLNIPRGATITKAYVQFTTKETRNTSLASLVIQGQAVDSAPTFSKTTNDISSRATTGASVTWSPPGWTVVGAAGADQQTPDLKAVVQEVVNRSGWASGNALALVITGTGRRVAESYNGVRASAPLLHVEYSTEETPPTQQYALTVGKAGSGSGTVTGTGINCGSDCTEAYDAGTQVALTAAPASGSTFAGWSGACSGTTACTVTMDGAKTVTATFTTVAATQYTLNATKGGTGSGTVTGAGISCGSDCSEAYAEGTQVTLTATAASGSTFVGWGGACTGSNGCTVVMDSSKTVTATFDLLAPPPGGQGAITSITQFNQFATGYEGGTSSGNPLTVPSIDPAGLVYHRPSGHLFISDSEINETSSVFSVVQANIFEISLTGDALHNKFNITPSSKGKNQEPTGIAYCPGDNRFYVSHDNTPNGIWRYRLENGDLHFEDQVTTPRGRDNDTTTKDDPEDVTCDPNTGLIYVVNGFTTEILVYSYDESYSEPNPGPGSRVATTHFKLERVIDLVQTAGDPSGIPSDAEGIGFDPVSGHLFVTSDPDEAIFEYTTSGVFVKKFSISGFSPRPIAPQGITIAPTSDGSGRESFYIIDGGVDNDQNANERDGRVYEAVITRSR